jgi:predicted glutamine amidotransferase
MCRFLAYVAPGAAAVSDLVPETLSEFIGLARENPDGWGMAAWNGDRLRVERSLISAGDDPRFLELAQQPLGDIGIVHLRAATPPLEINDVNSHPFVLGDLMMAHNGAIFPQETLDDILPAGSSHTPRGDTDSERYFLAIIEHIERGATPIEAIRRTVSHILSRFQPSCLNAFFVTPETLYAVSWHQPEPYREEYYRLFTAEQLLTYFHIRYRMSPSGLVLASTGWNQEGWRTIAAGSVLAVSRTSIDMVEYDLFSERSVALKQNELLMPHSAAQHQAPPAS